MRKYSISFSNEKNGELVSSANPLDVVSCRCSAEEIKGFTFSSQKGCCAGSINYPFKVDIIMDGSFRSLMDVASLAWFLKCYYDQESVMVEIYGEKYDCVFLSDDYTMAHFIVDFEFSLN